MLKISSIEIIGDIPFGFYLLSDSNLKRMLKEFEFYNVRFLRKNECSEHSVIFEYPYGNLFWFLDFRNAIEKEIYMKDLMYKTQWEAFLKRLKAQVLKEKEVLSKKLSSITFKEIFYYMKKYNLYDYQAKDLIELLHKMRVYDNPSGLIFSEQRTGKTRIAIAAIVESLKMKQNIVIVIVPKNALKSWETEFRMLEEYHSKELFQTKIVKTIKSVKDLKYNPDRINVRLISYDLFKLLSASQTKELMSHKDVKQVILVGDEVHRLRYFKTLQSEKIFQFKNMCITNKYHTTIIGITGTPAIKESADVFGVLGLINHSKIGFQPFIKDFNQFKEYFYICEDTQYGKMTKGLKRTNELNFLLQQVAVQTKQQDLELFKNYKKVYVPIHLNMDEQQIEMYNSMVDVFEFEEADAKNKLVQCTRLQQICTDPTGLVASYAGVAPKIKWVYTFIKTVPKPVIIMSKRLQGLESLKALFEDNGIPYSYLKGGMSLKESEKEKKAFREGDTHIFLIQFDVGKEAITLDNAEYTIFLDRDFSPGFNEQAEARMTPLDGMNHTKFVVDLIMTGTVEEQYYKTIIKRKEDIDYVNIVFNKIPSKTEERRI